MTWLRNLFWVLSLGLVVVMLVFNKVGSPQLVTWLAVPLVFGLARRPARELALPLSVALVIAAATQLVYPYLYDRLLVLDPVVLVLLTIRNALFLVLLGWVTTRLVRLAFGLGRRVPAEQAGRPVSLAGPNRREN